MLIISRTGGGPQRLPFSPQYQKTSSPRISFMANVEQFKTIGDLISKETVCCVGGKMKHSSQLSTKRSIRYISHRKKNSKTDVQEFGECRLSDRCSRYSWPLWLIKLRYYNEKFDSDHNWGLDGYAWVPKQVREQILTAHGVDNDFRLLLGVWFVITKTRLNFRTAPYFIMHAGNC